MYRVSISLEIQQPTDTKTRNLRVRAARRATNTDFNLLGLVSLANAFCLVWFYVSQIN